MTPAPHAWLLLSVMVLVTGSAIGQQSYYKKFDLVNCRFNNGIEIPQVECEATRKYFAAEAAKKAEQDSYTAKANAAFEADKVAAREERARNEAQWAADRVKQRAEQEALEAGFAKQREAENRAQAAADRKAAVVTSDLKARCGNDYKKPYIGMTLARAQECVTPMKLEGQFSGPNGVVNTYRGGGGSLFQFIDGRIVHWHK
jgi:hypothetical protein